MKKNYLVSVESTDIEFQVDLLDKDRMPRYHPSGSYYYETSDNDVSQSFLMYWLKEFSQLGFRYESKNNTL